MKTFTTYVRWVSPFCFVLWCIKSALYPVLHFTALARSVTKLLLQSPYLFGHVIAAANVDHCWSLLIRQCVVNCSAQDVCRRPPRLPLSRIWRQVRRRTRPATRPRTAALAAAEPNPVRGFPVKLLLCRLPARAPNEPSRGFHNHGEGPYKGLLLGKWKFSIVSWMWKC